MAVGGRNTEDNTTTAVHKYNPTTDSWEIISNMTTARDHCLVAVLPINEMIVVGGLANTWLYSVTDKVETVYIV